MQMDGSTFSSVSRSTFVRLVFDPHLPPPPGLPAVLRLVLRLLRPSAEDRPRGIPPAPRLLPGWHGRVCLQFHLSVEKVILFIDSKHVGLEAQLFTYIRETNIQNGCFKLKACLYIHMFIIIIIIVHFCFGNVHSFHCPIAEWRRTPV